MEYFKIAENDCNEIKNNILKIDDRNFFNSIVERGKDYFNRGKVERLIKTNENTYAAIVRGTELYNVNVKMNGKYIVNADCSCPFNVADDGYINPKLCKHIYATYMTIYELENKEYLNQVKTEYSEKYYSLYIEIIDKIGNLELTLKDKKMCNKYKKEFTQLYKTIQDTSSINELNSQMLLDLLCNFVIKSAEILDLLEKINISYKNEVIEKNIEDENVNKENNEITENSKPKESFIIKILDFCLAIVEGIFGLSSTNENEEDNTFENENEIENGNAFSYGDIVIVKYNGKIGEIIDVLGDYYTVKLKDEFENDYYASYYENELESYY